MTRDGMQWIAEELGLPSLDESVNGKVRASAAALARLEGVQPPSIEAAIASIAGIGPLDATLTSLLRRGRAGQRCSAELGDEKLKVACIPGPDDSLRVIVGPRSASADDALQQRAAAADRAAEVSHEVANALGAIIGWSELASTEPEHTSSETALRLIETSARIARETARDLLGTVRSGTSAMVLPTTDLGQVVQTVERLIHPEADKRNVRFDAKLVGAISVNASSSQLFTVLWNLTQNAIQALGEGGSVEIIGRRDGDQASIVVRDDGPGMSEMQAAQAFDAYFTTKAEGTGLGLALVRRVVESMQGSVELETAPGKGCTFQIRLPLAVGATKPTPVKRSSRAARPRARRKRRTTLVPDIVQQKISGVIERPIQAGTRVLIVEDNLSLRELLATTLEIRGAIVTATQSIADAEKLEQPFDIALIDMALPDGRGDHLGAMLREKGLAARIGLMSGGEPPADLDPDARPDRWIRKPFETVDLVHLIGELTAKGRDDASSLG